MLFLRGRVGPGCVNYPDDVKSVHNRLMQIAKIPCYVCNGGMDDQIRKGILAVQRHFMLMPDGVIDVHGVTHKFLDAWSEKPVSPGVVFIGRLREAWDLVNPLLPARSFCTSAFRTVEEQRRILRKFYKETCKADIIAKYTQKKYDAVSADLLANESQVLEMVRGVGQAIAAPGKSPHQRGKAIDVGGPNFIDAEQVRVIKLVARAHWNLLTGHVLRERNGCVHFEIH